MKPQAHATMPEESSASFLPSWSQTQVPAKRLTTFGLGCPLPQLFEPNTFAQLVETLQQLQVRKRKWRILGAGSNVILPPRPMEPAVIRLGSSFSRVFTCQDVVYTAGELSTLQEGGELEGVSSLHLVEQLSSSEGVEVPAIDVLAFAACPMMGLSRKSVKLGLRGFEFAAGIPGTIGGGVVMNAGAHGAELAQSLRRVYCLDSEGELHCFDKQELQLGYRRCSLPEGSCVVAAQFTLRAEDPKAVALERSRCLEYRKTTQPLHLPSSGSVFRNPPGERAAAELLEELGIKGLRLGGVEFSTMHANWLVRVDTDSSNAEDAANAAELIEIAQAKVKDAYGITLIPEIQLWGA